MKRMAWLVAACALGSSAVARADEVRELWLAKCKSCHGEDGKGDTKMGRKHKAPDFTNVGWHQRHTDEQLRKVIAEGSPENSKMKAYKDKLSAAEIDALVQYVRRLGGQ
jgi:cytochrome c553